MADTLYKHFTEDDNFQTFDEVQTFIVDYFVNVHGANKAEVENTFDENFTIMCLELDDKFSTNK